MKLSYPLTSLLLAALLTPALVDAQAVDPIREAPQTQIPIEQVLATPNDAIGTEVRWGGVIRGLRWRGDDVRVVVEQRTLKRKGKPTSQSVDRVFVADLRDVENRAAIDIGRRFTATGEVSGITTARFGEVESDAPVLSAPNWRTWRGEVPSRTTTLVNRGAFDSFGYYPYGRFGFRGAGFSRFGYRYGFRRYGFTRGRFY